MLAQLAAGVIGAERFVNLCLFWLGRFVLFLVTHLSRKPLRMGFCSMDGIEI